MTAKSRAILPYEDTVTRRASTDPVAWLMTYHHETGLSDTVPCSVIDAAEEVIDAHGGCVFSAFANNPDLRVEILAAHLLRDASLPARTRKTIIGLIDILEEQA